MKDKIPQKKNKEFMNNVDDDCFGETPDYRDKGKPKIPQFEEEFDEEEQMLINALMPGIDTVIDDCIEDIWRRYDKDGSGELDKAETKIFLKNTLLELGETGDFSENDFNTAFSEFDKDNNGTVNKEEMKIFIIKMANL